MCKPETKIWAIKMLKNERVFSDPDRHNAIYGFDSYVGGVIPHH
jgi:hypothetical protein